MANTNPKGPRFSACVFTGDGSKLAVFDRVTGNQLAETASADRKAVRALAAQMNRPQVETRCYRSSHGAEPRGRGSWAFLFGASREELDAKERSGRYLEFVWFVPGPSMLYGAALKLARKEATKRGALYLGVCS